MEPQNRNIQRLNFSTFLAAASLEFVARPDEHAHHFLAGFGPIRERRGRLPGADVGAAMTIASRAHRRPCARCGPPTARPTARAARNAHDTSSRQPASPSGGAGRRAGHEPHPLADGRNHRGGTLGGPGARPLSSRAGATSATACQWGLDGPSAAVRTPISLGKVANEGPGVRYRSGGRRRVPLH